jgi:hypothetical protein
MFFHSIVLPNSFLLKHAFGIIDHLHSVFALPSKRSSHIDQILCFLQTDGSDILFVCCFDIFYSFSFLLNGSALSLPSLWFVGFGGIDLFIESIMAVAFSTAF